MSPLCLSPSLKQNKFFGKASEAGAFVLPLVHSSKKII
jgi:hypothetical protein